MDLFYHYLLLAPHFGVFAITYAPLPTVIWAKNAPPPLLEQETCAVLDAYTPEMLPW